MKTRIIFLTIIVITAIVASRCTYRASEPNICFQRDILPIFVQNCGGCHGATSGAGGEKDFDLTTYDGIMTRVVKHHPLRSDVYTSIKGNNPDMPPEGHKKLSSDQVYLIKAWISMGAQNTSNCTTCDTSLHKFSSDIQPIMNAWCSGSCHTASSPDGGYDLSNYNGVKTCALSGKLMGSITHASMYVPMPKGGGKLPDCDITKIQNWISAGCLNN